MQHSNTSSEVLRIDGGQGTLLDVRDRRAPDRILQRLDSLVPLRCAECGRFSDPEAAGWRGCRVDLEEDGDPRGLAFFCPVCAEDGFGR